MLTLRRYQSEVEQKALRLHGAGIKSLCIVMPTGGGKTITGSHLSLTIGSLRHGPVLWLAHRRELIKQAAKSLERYGVEVGIIAPWARRNSNAPVQVGSIQTVRLLEHLPDAAVVVWDECFPAGTLVGGKLIETYAVGDSVVAFDHSKNEIAMSKVSHVFKNTVGSLVRVRTSVGSIVCTPSHPVYSKGRGYVAASNLLSSDEVVHVCDPDLLHLREGICAKTFELQEHDSVLFCRMPRSSLENQTVYHHGEDQQNPCVGQNENPEPNAAFGNEREGFQNTQGDWAQAEAARGQRSAVVDTTGSSTRMFGTRMDAGTCGVCSSMQGRAPHQLQDRHCEPGIDDSHRSRREYPWHSSSQTSGPAQGSVPSFARVDSVEVLEPGRDGTFGGLCPDGHVYNLEVEKHNNYFANGILVHNCHHAVGDEWIKLAKACAKQKAFLIGLTATPERSDGKGLFPTFRRMLVAAKTSDLIQGGYLVPAEVLVPSRLITDGIANVPVTLWEQHALDTRTVVFCSSVEHAQATTQEFLDRGYRAAWIDGSMPAKQRDRILRSFEVGRTQILCNCQILTEGFDLPAIETVLLARTVGSHALYLQMVGRGLRPEKGKTKLTLLDATGCSRLYGHPNLDRKYSLKGKPIELANDKKSSPKTCHGCGLLLQEQVRECPKCGLAASSTRRKKRVYNDPLEKMSEGRRAEFEQWFFERALDRARGQEPATAEEVARNKFFKKFGRMPRQK